MSSGIILGNRILDVVILSTFLAQFYKVFSPLLKGERVKWSRLFQTGGMPSSHASTVMCLVTLVAFLRGISSLEFALSSVFASVVLYDATGVRREAGEHAKALNKLIESIEKSSGIEIITKQFKEFLGHTPYEVLWGSILGIVLAFVFKGYVVG